jgi:hypothetical protein
MALHSVGRVSSSHNALLVVHCDGPIAPERVTASLERFLRYCPWPAARLRRPFPWGKLHWATGPGGALTPPLVRRRTLRALTDLEGELDAELNTPIDPRREAPLRFLLVDGAPDLVGARGVLVMTWFHPLMDPHGAQNLLQHLAHLDRHAGDAPWGDAMPDFVPAPDQRPFRERGRLARQSLEYMKGLPRASAASPVRVPSGRVRFRQVSFVERDPSAAGSRGTREIWWRLAVVGNAMRQMCARRGLPDLSFLLPIAVDLRPKGEPGPTFGNMLAFHFARFSPADAADVPRLASALRAQMADAVREGQIEANAVAMEFLQYRPLAMIRRSIRWTSGGETFSFNCADVMDFPAALAVVFGRRVVNAYHVPAVPPRPGIGVFFNRSVDRNNLVVAWIDGVVSDDDVTRIVEVVAEGMGWIRTS